MVTPEFIKALDEAAYTIRESRADFARKALEARVAEVKRRPNKPPKARQ